jgi:hypothetical protein
MTKMHVSTIALLAAALVAPFTGGCAEKVCRRGDIKSCFCGSGSGQQKCTDDGTAWEKCVCADPKKETGEPSGPRVEVVSAEDLGPADPNDHPNESILRLRFKVSGSLTGEPMVKDAAGHKITGRREIGDPSSPDSFETFIVPKDGKDFRLAIGPDDPGVPVGEIKTIEAAQRFKQRSLREHR